MDVPRRGARYRRLRSGLALVGPAVLAVTVLTGALSASLRLALRDAPAAGSAAVGPSARAGAPAVVASPPAGSCGVAPADAAARAVHVLVPEVYELANVALTLTAYAEREQHTTWRRGSYYAAVMDHFGAFRDHPLIERLDRELSGADGGWRYYAFRESSAAYAFGERGLVRSSDRQYWPHDLFGALAGEAEAFAAATDFRAFYSAHEREYARQVELYRRLVPLHTMWDWLERRFPERYQSYRVVFSPLIHGSHSTRRFDGETVMFIAGPGVVEGAAADSGRIALARIVFTEIDHNYVNPATDRFRGRVDAVFADLDDWHPEPTRFYGSAYATFNEYMTWAVFSLFVRDTDPDLLPATVSTLERIMLRRGFPRFREFNDALLDLAASDDGGCVADLYPLILDWAERWR